MEAAWGAPEARLTTFATQDYHPDPDRDPVIPCVRLKLIQKIQHAGIPYYSRLECH